MDDADRAYLEEAFDHWVRAGYGLEGLLDELRERAEDLVGEVSEDELDQLAAYVEGRVADQLELEASWGDEETVNDRIDEAFAELLDDGIVALQNAGYTLSDGWEDAEEARRDVPDAVGAVFWHGQDTERAVRGEGLLLAFGSFTRGAGHVAESLEVARKACDALRKHGVEVAWSGELNDRIRIAPFAWRKRSTAR